MQYGVRGERKFPPLDYCHTKKSILKWKHLGSNKNLNIKSHGYYDTTPVALHFIVIDFVNVLDFSEDKVRIAFAVAVAELPDLLGVTLFIDHVVPYAVALGVQLIHFETDLL